MKAGASIHPIPVKKRTERNRRTQLLQRCRSLVLERLSDALKNMLDKADDALFDLADKSVNTVEQTLYFDAMRDIRLKREAIVRDYRVQFERAFDQKCRARCNARLDFHSRQAEDMEFELVADDDMEENIAVSNMQAKTVSNCREELFALDKRIAVLLGESSLDSDDNPLGPRTICGAVQEACHVLDAGLNIHLIILKLFDKYVLNKVPQVYRDINRLLADNDILPQIRTTVPTGARRRADGSGSPAGDIEEAEQDMLATLQRLVELRAGQANAPGPALSGAPATGAAAQASEGGVPSAKAPGVNAARGPMQNSVFVSGGSGVAPGTAASAVITGLTTLQHGDFGALSEGGPLSADTCASGRVNILHELKTARVLGSLGHDDQVIIDIVAMLFDYILDDEDIPDSIKALIGRLQIPILKVAILDRTFFSRKQHPARRLLDTLAEAAIGWNENSDSGDRLFEQIESSVHRILNEFEDDIGLFSTVLDELQAYLNSEHRQAEQRANRSAEVFKRKERLEEAKRASQAELASRLARADQFVGPFLQEHWQNLLVMLHLKHGPDSKSWHSGLETMDDLLWSVTPKRSAEERQRLVALLPRLVRRLRNGMTLIALSPGSTQAFLGELAQRHAAVVRVGPAEVNQPPENDETCASSQGATPIASDKLPQTLARSTEDDSQPEAPLVDLTDDPFADTLARAHSAYYERPVGAPEAGQDIDHDNGGGLPGLDGPDAEGTRQHTADPGDKELTPLNQLTPAPDSDEPTDSAASGPCTAMSEHAGCEQDVTPESFAASGHSEPAAADPQDLDKTIPEPGAAPFIKAGWLQFGEDDADMEIEEITLGEVLVTEEEIEEDPDDEHLQRARDLVNGTWVEFTDDRGASTRARLSWVSSATGVYLFTDRKGLKVAERTLFGLAAEFRRGSARIIESVPLIDRAVSNLLNGFSKGVTA